MTLPRRHNRQHRLRQRSMMSSFTAARSWAAYSLPRLIVCAIGIHFLFSGMLVAQIGRRRRQRRRHLAWQQQHAANQEAFVYPLPRIRPSTTDNQNSQSRADKKKNQQNLNQYDDDDDKDGTKQRQPQKDQGAPGDVVLDQYDDLYVQHLFNMSQQIQLTLHGAVQVISCRWRHNSEDIYHENCDYHHHQQQQGQQRRIALFNPLEQERILCDGSRIGPASIRILGENDLSCSEPPPRLFTTVPTIEAKHDMEPMELVFREGSGKLRDFPCDVPCRSDSSPPVVTKRAVRKTPFAMYFSMEGSQYYNQLRVNPKAHRYHEYYSTTSFRSEIPLPYFSFDEYGDSIRGTAVEYDSAIKGAVFLASNCNSRNNREDLVESLIDSEFPIYSVGSCKHNAEAPDGLTEKVAIMRRYLFSLAFENQCEDDYITEKLWGALKSGTVPVYYGAYNVLDHVPPNSIIDANSFNSSDDLALHLHKVAGSKELYETYHEWRRKPLPEAFVQKYNFTRDHSTCRTCRWAFAKKYGLGWDHRTQMVENLHIPRMLCHDARGVLTHPFQETWMYGTSRDILLTSNNAQPKSSDTCHVGMINFTTALGEANSLHRKVHSQDGVIDIFLDSGTQSMSDEIILRMDNSIATDAMLTVISRRRFRFQDATKRITILTNVDATMNATGQGVLELSIPLPQTGIQLRAIIEDIDTFYPDSINRTNYFGQMMTEDFLNPLEKFVVWGTPQNKSSWDGHTLTTVGVISTEEDDASDSERAHAEDEFHEKAHKAVAENTRRSLAFTTSQKRRQEREARDKKAIAGIKKLLASGIIPGLTGKSDNQLGEPETI